MEERVRQIAHKTWIVDLLHSEYFKTSGEWEPNYVLVRGNKVSRVNVVATIIGKIPSEGCSVLDIDDGSGTISVRAWGDDAQLFQSVDVGDFVLLIGKVKDYNGKTYLTPEIVRKVDARWMKVRQAELKQESPVSPVMVSVTRSSVSKPESLVVSEEYISEEVVEDDSLSSREELLHLVSSSEDGLDVSVLREKITNADKILEELINDGEVFKVGERVRVMG